MEIIHTIYASDANGELENVDLNDLEKRKSLILKTPTITLPFLETEEGNISESKAIEFYFCSKYKPELLGNSTFEKALVNQWIEFACCEINKCVQSIIYPIFGWAPYCKENAEKENGNIKNYLKNIENNFKSKNTPYIVGNKITLADIILFRYLRFFMMFHFPEGMRNSLFPQTTKWFERIMNSTEAIKAYGRTILCKNPIKAFTGEIKKSDLPKENKENNENKKEEPKEEPEQEKKGKKNKKDKKNKNNDNKNEKKNENKNKKENQKENKKEVKKTPIVKEVAKTPYVPSMLELPRFKVIKKENNPLDALPPSSFNLEKFKNEFIKNTNKEEAMNQFWKEYDSKGYSIWFIEYNNEPGELISLFRTVIKKGDILLQLQYFKQYCFGVLGVYGSDGDYKIQGCMVWRGQEIPDEMKDIVCYRKLKFRKLNENENADKELIHDFWTKIDEKEKVLDKLAIDTRYFY